MDKVITTALFIIVSMILVVMLFNAVYPAVQEGSEAVTSMAYNVSDRMRNQISVIHASPNFDLSGLCPSASCEVKAWVKNTGKSTISALDRVDVFFGPEGNFARIPTQSEAGGGYPYWRGEVVNEVEGNWVPTGTLQITIYYNVSPPTHGRYFLKVSLPDGNSSDYFLGI